MRFSKLTWNAAERRFNRITQRFTLNYYDRGVLKQQNLQRTVTRPNILFDAKPLPPLPFYPYYFSKMAEATTTARWINLAYLSGNSAAAGPGIITPAAGITITFDSSPPLPPNPYARWRWGSFDQTASPPVLFPPTYAEE